VRLSLAAVTTATAIVTGSPALASQPTLDPLGDSASARVTVAVLDTGITAHSALNRKGVMLPGYDFVSDPWSAADGDGWDADPTDQGDGVKPLEAQERPNCRAKVSSWHGTNVAGTIAAQGSKKPLTLGIAPEASIVPVRIMGRCGGNTADVAAGMLWAVGEPVPGVPDNANPARIINVSLSGPADRCPRALQTAIDIARERGAIVVVAAGSSGRDTAGTTPSNCSGVTVVGATDKFGKRSPTSNYGVEVTVSALGGDMSTGAQDGIRTTSNRGTYRPRKQEYDFYQGSSAAAARVSGALAVLASRNPAASPDELEAQLLSYTDPFAPGQCDRGDGKCGDGIVNLRRLVAGR
jgi:serine protease